MSLSLEQLKAAFKSPERSANTLPSNYYPFYRMKAGEQATIRFLPDKNADNPLGFLVEKHTHILEINGERKTVPCLKMYGEECPICKVAQAYYQAGDETNGKKFYRKKSHIAQVLVVEDPLPADENTGERHEGKVRYVNLGYQLYNIIKDTFESGELEEIPFAYENGTNFIIKKTQQGEYSTYATGSRFARHETDLTAEEIEHVEEHMIDLSTLLPANPGLERVEAMLEAALTGGSVDDTPSVVSDPAPSKPAPSKPAPVAVAEEVDDSDDQGDDADQKAQDILAKIRARNKARAE